MKNNVSFEISINSKLTNSLLINLTLSPGKSKLERPPSKPTELSLFRAPLPSEFPLPFVGGGGWYGCPHNAHSLQKIINVRTKQNTRNGNTSAPDTCRIYNPGQNYLRKFSPSCPLSYATKLFPKRRLCGKKTPSPNSMLLPTNTQGSDFLLNTHQHCFQGKGEREEPVQLRCLGKCCPNIQFSQQFCPRL